MIGSFVMLLVYLVLIAVLAWGAKRLAPDGYVQTAISVVAVILAVLLIANFFGLLGGELPELRR